jgi:hypothetical protein
MLLPHIVGSSFVTSRIIFRTAKQSSRRVLSATLLRNVVTLSMVGFVLSSAMVFLFCGAAGATIF